MACKCAPKRSVLAANKTSSTSSSAGSCCGSKKSSPLTEQKDHGSGCDCCSGPSGCACHPEAAKAYADGCPCCADYTHPSKF